jgi:hypothetical protein
MWSPTCTLYLSKIALLCSTLKHLSSGGQCMCVRYVHFLSVLPYNWTKNSPILAHTSLSFNFSVLNPRSHDTTSWFGRTIPQQFISPISHIITQNCIKRNCPQIIIYTQPLSPSGYNISHLHVSLSFCQLQPGVFTKTDRPWNMCSLSHHKSL